MSSSKAATGMTIADLEKYIKDNDTTEPTLTTHAIKILEKRYLEKDKSGVTETPQDMFIRVAANIANVDQDYGDDPRTSALEFYNHMVSMKFLPNSPTLRGAGRHTMMSACSVLPIEDSRTSIFNTLRDAIELQAHGVGTGFNFTPLRHKGAKVTTTGGEASGPVSFMSIFDLAVGKVISQGGVRQGASIGILAYNHPDILEFISCKSDGKSLSNFNISVGVTEEFMRMAIAGQDYPLIDYKGNETGKLNATDVLTTIADQAWATGDPGIIFLDRINRDNPTPKVGAITATNPCGEVPLLPMELCNLGSINLSKFVKKDDTIDYEALGTTVSVAVRFLDNVIDANVYPIPEVEAITKNNRKIGIGVMGFANMLSLMRIPYNSEAAVKLAGGVMRFIKETAKKTSVEIAGKRGVFPNFEGSIYDNGEAENKVRNASWTTIAPGGTIGLLADCNGGIEPYFMVVYERGSVYDSNGNATIRSIVVCPTLGEVLQEEGVDISEDTWKKIASTGNLTGIREIPKHISKMFLTAHDIHPSWHLKMQSAFQEHTTSAVSKTVNLPHNATIKDVYAVYVQAHKLNNIKGVTVYRDGCKEGQVMQAVGTKQGAPEPLTTSSVVNGSRPKKLPGFTDKIETPVGSLYVTINTIQTGEIVLPVEMFLNIGKAGADVTADAEAIGKLASLCLQYNIPVPLIVKHLSGIGGSSSTGFGKNRVKSLPDAVAKVLENNFIKDDSDVDEPPKEISGKRTGNMCPECGVMLVESEGCTKCPDCGYSAC